MSGKNLGELTIDYLRDKQKRQNKEHQKHIKRVTKALIWFYSNCKMNKESSFLESTTILNNHTAVCVFVDLYNDACFHFAPMISINDIGSGMGNHHIIQF